MHYVCMYIYIVMYVCIGWIHPKGILPVVMTGPVMYAYYIYICIHIHVCMYMMDKTTLPVVITEPVI
jgi:hypothetical protein